MASLKTENPVSESISASPPTFLRKKHIKFFVRCLDVLPSDYQSLDTNRMTVLFFAILGLDLLGELESAIDETRRRQIVAWIYSLQVLSPTTTTTTGLPAGDENLERVKISNRASAMHGFRSSPSNGARLSDSYARLELRRTNGRLMSEEAGEDEKRLSDNGKDVLHEPIGCLGTPIDNDFDASHVTMTYNALASLLMLKDRLEGVDRDAILQNLRSLQQPDGSFAPMSDGGERDVRFVFCAAAVQSMLAEKDHTAAIDVDKAANFVGRSLSYEGAFGMSADAEAHGGSSFCALASLILFNRLHSSLSESQIEALKRWFLLRQQGGFQGRVNKPADCCYSFWVGAGLKLLGAFDLVDVESNTKFTLSCQNPVTGGFSKWPKCHPDALHAALGLAGLSILEEASPVPQFHLKRLYPSLNITVDAFEHLQTLRQKWFD